MFLAHTVFEAEAKPKKKSLSRGSVGVVESATDWAASDADALSATQTEAGRLSP